MAMATAPVPIAAENPFHPELRGLARWLPRGVASPWLVWLSRRLPVPTAKLRDGFTVVERRVAGPESRPVRLISAPAQGGALRPAMLWIHGGGYVIGDAKIEDVMCARFAKRLGAVVLSVDYRLAPQHPFPAPLDDCLAAYDFVHREAASLGIDPTRVIVAGASAGGGLAAALVLRIHDLKRPAPVFQLLVYPMLDDRTVLREVPDRDLRLWNPSSNRYGWTSYLGREPGSPDVPDHAAPGRRVDFTGLPPAWIGVGTRDLFHAEDVTYAERLRAAGVPVTLDIVDGAFHGFDVVAAKAAVSRRFFDAQVAAIEAVLGVASSK
jgi:acetyl esterase/lipase